MLNPEDFYPVNPKTYSTEHTFLEYDNYLIEVTITKRDFYSFKQYYSERPSDIIFELTTTKEQIPYIPEGISIIPSATGISRQDVINKFIDYVDTLKSWKKN